MYGREELTEKPLSRVGRRPIPVPAGVEIDILKRRYCKRSER
ncbi:MAG: hypothetical protein CM1200mP15_11500 [Dehalococcoidia bacterium]|nr:MAG: hypothetical protein CM1200mP15_11500 [Dehalococcoidia bacterium]